MIFVQHQTFQPTSAPLQAPSPTWMSNPATATHPIVSGGGYKFSSLNPDAIFP